MKKHLSILLVIALLGYTSAQALTVNVTTAGTLATLIGSSASTTTDLTVTGTIDQRDIACMNSQMPVLSTINISGATIMAYGTFPANQLPINSFSNKASLKNITLPSTITIIGNASFLNCKGLTVVSLPSKVKTVGTDAFKNCSELTTVNFPASLRVIGKSAFQACWKLTSISSMPTAIKTIGANAFESCIKLTGTLSFTSATTSIGTYAFARTEISSVTIASTTTILNKASFGFCKSLTSATLPEGTTTLVEQLFNGCTNLKSINLPSTIITIAPYALCNTGLTSINIPAGVTVIGEAAFHAAPITTVALPAGLTTISIQLFSNCNILNTLSIPAAVTSIQEFAFHNCTSLSSLTVNSATPISLVSVNSISGINKATCTLYVPAGSKALYQATPFWNEFLTIIEMSAPLKDANATAENLEQNIEVELVVYTTAESIEVSGCNTGDTIAVRSINGTVLNTITATSNTVSIPVQSTGIYLVQVGSKIVKVIK